MSLRQIEALDGVIEPMLHAARVPGAAVAVVADGKVVLAKGYGFRDLKSKLPVTSKTVYPIASTSKAFNATLLGTLLDDGRLDWDDSVTKFLPGFRLRDPVISPYVTVRDLLTMRTGLPRHDWLWIGNPMSRADLVERLRYLELSAGFRERFQYNNLTSTTAGHLAEVITGKSWETLVQQKILDPLGMKSTVFGTPTAGDSTLMYHETASRELVQTNRLECEVTAPSGGSIHSTVEDMARWIAFNLSEGQVGDTRLIRAQTLAEIHAPQVSSRTDPASPTPNAAYALGWFTDVYNGHARVSHGGYLHDVNSEISLFPADAIGIVSFTNFGCPTLARTINQHAFDLMMGLKPAQAIDEKLAQYEKKISEIRVRNSSVRRVECTVPSHDIKDYTGAYEHLGYGRFEVSCQGGALILQRKDLVLPLEHWHYDAWIVRPNDLFAIHLPHAFDAASRILFEVNADGEISAFSITLEPAVAPIRFEKVTGA